MDLKHILRTGSTRCYDENGKEIDCRGSGHDAETRPGIIWPEPRFQEKTDDLVLDRCTGLVWTRKATLSDFPLTWQESLRSVEKMNSEAQFGRKDWRLPNRRELRSLIDHSAKNPALPQGHPFQDVFLGWYWTSTTAAIAPRYAWYVHLEGGRMFYGNKGGYFWAWPVCSVGQELASTGQRSCFDEAGTEIPCRNTGQDGDLQCGVSWDGSRFEITEDGFFDRLTGLIWHQPDGFTKKTVNWPEALQRVEAYAGKTGSPWRLPTINELESLVHAGTCDPALPEGHPFGRTEEAYWSSTTSGFETDWAYVLYLRKGAVGVGFKNKPSFGIWPVRQKRR